MSRAKFESTFERIRSWTAPLSINCIRRLTAPQRSLPAKTVAIMFGYPPELAAGDNLPVENWLAASSSGARLNDGT